MRSIVVDAGPLIALFRRRDKHHDHVRQFLARVPARLVSTLPVITEVCHFLNAEGKLAFLKSWLGITEAQNGPWNAFADVVRAQAKSLAESQQKRMPTPGKPESTLPQWVDQHLQMMEENLAAMKKIKPALDTLYQALTPEQRQKADQLVRMR